MSGQTISDRLLAARHSIAGQGLAKSVCKATTEEVIGPKKKHLDCKFLYNSSLSTQLNFSHVFVVFSPGTVTFEFYTFSSVISNLPF